MRARPPVTQVEARHVVVRTELEAADGTALAPLEVRVPRAQADMLDPTATAGAAVLTTLAAARGEDLVIEGSVDDRMAHGAVELGRLLSGWWDTGTTTVEVQGTHTAPAGGEGVGLFFSRGVDSWSTLLDLLDHDPPDRVTHLITVHHARGATARALEAEMFAVHGRVADELGLDLVVLETSARAHLDPLRTWLEVAGPAFMSAGLQIATGLHRLVLSGDHVADFRPRTGADPDVVATVSTSRTAVVLGNPDRTRDERIAHLAADRLARSTLQVCWEGGTSGNCGRCRKCQHTMAALLLVGDPHPDAGFDHGPDPDLVRGFDLLPYQVTFVMPVIEGLPPEHEELRRAWSDAWERSQGVEPRERWGDDGPPGLAGPGLPERVAAALRATTGQAVAPAPAPLGWRPGTVPLRPLLGAHDEVRARVATNGDRPHAWAVVEHHIRDAARDGHQAALAARLGQLQGPGPCYLPGILWAYREPPMLDRDAVARLLGTARARLWWRAGGDLEPLRVVESIEQGCLPLQVMPAGAARDLAEVVPAPLAGLVVDEAELGDLDLSPTGVAVRLEPAVEHLLAGSAEHDLLAGAYR